MIPILFVHGSWHGDWCWKEHFTTHLYDSRRPYHTVNLDGDQGEPNSLRGASLGDFCAKVAEKVEEIVTDTGFVPILVGHSMGGAVVQRYFELHPRNKWPAPSGIVLMASVPPSGALASLLRFRKKHPEVQWDATLSQTLKKVVGTLALAREALFDEDMTDEEASKYFALLKDESFRGFWDTILFGLPRPYRIPRPLPPVLVLGAGDDEIFTREEVEETARAYATTAVIIEGVAHDMMLSPRWIKALEPIMEFQEFVSKMA